MLSLSRRSFLKGTAAAATASLLPALSYGRVIGANDTIRVGCAGVNGRGRGHVTTYAGMKDVEIVYLIDPDTRTYKKNLDTIAAANKPAPKTIKDVRQA